MFPTHNKSASVQDIILIAQSFLDRGRIGDAVSYFERALEMDPERADIHFYLGYCFHLGQEPERAVRCYRLALNLAPDMADAHHNLGQALLAQGRIDQAIDSYRQAIALQNSPDYYFSLGRALLEKSLFDDAAHALKNALSINPYDAEGHGCLGLAFLGQGDSAGAEASFVRALALDPGQLENYHLLGQFLRDHDRLEEARQVFEDSLTVDPHQIDVLLILAELNVALHRLAEAMVFYGRALKLNPQQAEVHNNLGVLLKSLDQPDQAAESFARALAINPDLAEARANLGEILFARGKVHEAEECLVQALTLNPDLAEARACLGLVYRNQGRIREAVDCFHRSLALNGKTPGVHYELALALMSLQRYPEAAGEFQTVLELDPDFPQLAELTKNLGIALHRAGYFRAAASALAHSWRVEAGDPETERVYQETIRRQKEIEQTIRSFHQRLKPEFPGSEAENDSGPGDPAASGLAEEPSIMEASKNLPLNALIHQGRHLVPPSPDRAFLHNLILKDFPQFDDSRADDLETVTILRQFTYQKINEAFDQSVCLDQDPVFNLAHRPVAEIFQAFCQDKGGVWCGGAAKTYVKLCHSYGYRCHTINLGHLTGGLSHVITLVEIFHHGRQMLVVQDSYLNTSFLDLNHDPLDYFDFLTILRNGGHERIVPEVHEHQTRSYLVPSRFESEVAKTWHFRLNDRPPRPVDRLADGTLKYLVRPAGDLLLATNNGLQRFLTQRGHPLNILYFHLYPSAVYSDHQAAFLAGKTIETLEDSPYEIKKAVRPNKGTVYLHR